MEPPPAPKPNLWLRPLGVRVPSFLQPLQLATKSKNSWRRQKQVHVRKQEAGRVGRRSRLPVDPGDAQNHAVLYSPGCAAEPVLHVRRIFWGPLAKRKIRGATALRTVVRIWMSGCSEVWNSQEFFRGPSAGYGTGVSGVPQSVAVNLENSQRHHAVDNLLADRRSRHEDHSMQGAKQPVQASLCIHAPANEPQSPHSRLHRVGNLLFFVDNGLIKTSQLPVLANSSSGERTSRSSESSLQTSSPTLVPANDPHKVLCGFG